MEKREIEREEGETDNSEIERRGRHSEIERRERHSEERNREKKEKNSQIRERSRRVDKILVFRFISYE